MKKVERFYLLVIMGVFAFGCGNNEKPAVVATPAPKKPELMQPFRYHKLIEVSPGQDYDIFSWGRGAANTSAFEILHSDSVAAKFTTTTGDLTGQIVDVFNTDMDLDGNPEIIIQAKGTDTVNYTHMYAFEFNNSKAQPLDFPKLTFTQRQGYRGGDDFYVKDGKLIREFPVYDASTKPTGQKRQLEYGMRDNELFAKQLTKDSTNVKTAVKPAASQTTDKPKKQKHNSETTHKKKKHRHHSDD